MTMIDDRLVLENERLKAVQVAAYGEPATRWWAARFLEALDENARLAQEIKELAAWKLENERVRIEESIVDMNKQLAATVAQLREALVKCALPYEALLMDAESRRWIAPSVWKLIVEAVDAARGGVLATTGGTMIDRLAELCDRVAELEAENARLVATIAQLRAAGVRLRDIWGLQSKSHYSDRDLVAAVHDIAVALEETAPKEQPLPMGSRLRS